MIAPASSSLARCAVSEYTTRCWSFDKDVEVYARLGFAAIGVFLHKLEDPAFGSGMLLSKPLPASAVQRAASRLAASGLAVSHVALSGNWTDPARHDDQIAHTLFAMEATEQLGCDCLLVVPGRLAGNTHEQAIELSATALGEVLERSPTEVRLAIEPLRAFQLDFINGFGEALDLVRRVGHPRLGVWVDLWHVAAEPNLLEALERETGHIFGIELADSLSPSPEDPSRIPPGQGVLPLGELVAAAERGGYRGYYSLELAPSGEDTSGYEQALETSRAYLSELLAGT